MEHRLRHRTIVSAALLLVTMVGAPFAGPRHASSEELPNTLGIPGLVWSNTVPTSRSAPFRVGVQYGYGNFDPEGGVNVDFGKADLRSQDIRLQLQLRAASAVRIAAAVPLRILTLEGGESVTGLGDIQGAIGLRLTHVGRTGLGLWGSLTVPSGEESKGLTTGKIDGEFGFMTQTRFFGGGYAPRTDLIFNIGYRFNKDERDGYGWQAGPPSEVGGFFPIYPAISEGGSNNENDQLLLRAALQFRQRWGAIFLEWSADWFNFSNDIEFSESPSWFTPGVVFGDDDPELVHARGRLRGRRRPVTSRELVDRIRRGQPAHRVRAPRARLVRAGRRRNAPVLRWARSRQRPRQGFRGCLPGHARGRRRLPG